MDQPSAILRFRCRSCDRLLQIPENLAGRAVRCPACFHIVHAPPGGLEEMVPVDEIPVVEPLEEIPEAEEIPEIKPLPDGNFERG